MRRRNEQGEQSESGPALPDDWCGFAHPHAECDADHARMQEELEIELHPAHPLHGCALKVIAHATGNDDVLCVHARAPKRYTVIHLTWRGAAESGDCPTVDFDGDWNGVRGHFDQIANALAQVAEDERLGRRRPMTKAGTPSRPVVIRHRGPNGAE